MKLINFLLQHSFSASHYAGTKATVAGWGSINEKGSPSCVLRAVKIPIMTNLECVHLTAYSSGMVTENMMCAGYLDGDGDSCQVIRLWMF